MKRTGLDEVTLLPGYLLQVQPNDDDNDDDDDESEGEGQQRGAKARG